MFSNNELDRKNAKYISVRKKTNIRMLNVKQSKSEIDNKRRKKTKREQRLKLTPQHLFCEIKNKWVSGFFSICFESFVIYS
jgi:hypothetical protein